MKLHHTQYHLMGLFAVSLAGAIVVLQSTLILSNRKPNLWVFTLLQKRNVDLHWGNVSGTPHSDAPFETEILPLLPSSASSMMWYMPSLFACMRECWDAGHWPPTRCENGFHLPQEVTSIAGGASWNPHLILLAIACVHLVMVLSTAQAQHLIKENSEKRLTLYTETGTPSYSTRMYQFPLSLCLILLFMLWLIVGLVAANVNHSKTRLFDTPTILMGIILLLGCAYFLHVHYQYYSSSWSPVLEADYSPEISSYFLWNQTFQLQFIAVPLTVLMLSVMGVRIYSDVLTHLILLSTSVNSLWLQDKLFSFGNSKIFILFLKALTVGIPLFCLWMAQEEWGEAGTWQRVTVYMAYVSLAPLLIFSMMFSEGAAEGSSYQRDKMRTRLCTISTMVALGSSVVNLALL